MRVKKYKILSNKDCWRVYWDGRAIIGEVLSDNFKWEIYASVYKHKKRNCFCFVTFEYGKYYCRPKNAVTKCIFEYSHAADAIQAMERFMSRITIPNDVRETLDAYDMMSTLSSNKV